MSRCQTNGMLGIHTCSGNRCFRSLLRAKLSPEACQQRKKDSASRRSTSGSQLSLSKPTDVGHSTVPDDSSLR